MDTDELISALSDDGNVPSPDAVMGRFRGEQRRRARVRSTIGGGFAAAAVVVAVVTVLPRASGPASSASGNSAVGSAAGTAVGTAAGRSAAAPAPRHEASSGSAGLGTTLAPALTCGPLTLPERLAAAAQAGASVVLADGTFTGRAANGYEAVSLRDVRTLSGPPVASGTGTWVPAATARTMLPGSGQVFAIVWPATATRDPRAPGPVLTAAPVRGGEVLLRAGNCWGGTPDTPVFAVERLVTGK
jgi:hypothetical protein